jgi:hypothetical protein
VAGFGLNGDTQALSNEEYLVLKGKIYLCIATGTAAFSCITPMLLRGQTSQASNSTAARMDEAIVFDQTKTTQHVRLLSDGGVIELTTNSPSDGVGRDAIRQHLVKMEAMFKQGDFRVPTIVYGQTPPGVATMKRLKNQLRYTVENLPEGGEVRITTSNPEARSAVYDFLRFQIREHKIGDTTEEPSPVKRPHPANNLGHDARPGPR